MPESKPWPRYLCHKEVWALKIAGVEWRPDMGHYVITFQENGYPPVEVSKQWADKFGPKRNTYLVRYADGYQSISPERAFEEGYSVVQP